MADVKNVLVFPAGTEIAFEINDALRYSKFVKLYGGTSLPCHADFVFENCIEGLPFVDDPALIDCLNSVIDKYGIDFIYPAHDSALLSLTLAKDRLKAAVVTSPVETVEICRSKNKTYAFLKGVEYLPSFYSSPNDVPSYPVFIKPSVGQGSQGARIINDRSHLEEALMEGTEYTICEYLPGAEYTVDCFTDIHGNLKYVNPRTRDRIRAGIAVRSHNIPATDEISAIASDLNSRLRFNGAWFFQIKENSEGKLRLMEAAPRIAGTMGLSRNLGVNMPLLTLFNMWGYEVDIISNGNNLLLDRAFISRFKTSIHYSNVYVDFDDTLIINGKVNSFLMMFLYQAKSKGTSLYLLTRHSTDIHADLKKYHIADDLFDDIYHIDSEGSKASFVRPDSIFIDDSFAERKRVKDECGIPVFDPDMVESLIDWRA